MLGCCEAWLGTGTEDTGTEEQSVDSTAASQRLVASGTSTALVRFQELASALPAGLQKLHLMLESCTETCFAALRLCVSEACRNRSSCLGATALCKAASGHFGCMTTL